MDEGSVEFALERSFELQAQLAEADTDEEKTKLMTHFIESSQKVRLPVCPDFRTEWNWFNTNRHLTVREDLVGRITVLDFFTYCCINCIHVLPDLHKVEERFPIKDGVVVIGVHSAKFDNEKVSANILSAVIRYNIRHPVVNDSEADLWQQLQISCWPTLVVLGPSNEILLFLAGEGHSETIQQFIAIAKDIYERTGELKSGKDVDFMSLEKNRVDTSTLQFPGKISWDSEGKTLAISDTGQHRVLIVDHRGVILHTVGGKSCGLRDGTFTEARFFNPQGVAWRRNMVYVADTDNHCVRQINLVSLQVTTVAGTGSQGHDYEGGNLGREQPISSPWDVALGSSKSGQDDLLFIAIAGSHQIWILFFENSKWIKNRSYSAGTCVMFAGSGQEENRNNNYPHRAAFAQPSGITTGRIGGVDHLFIADAESSSIRTISLADGAVKGLVGGDRDPTNLFAYGDQDGVGISAKLQHPLGVAVQDDQTVLVADSYNHKIKKVDVTSKKCETLPTTFGNEKGPVEDGGTHLNEPGGICLHPKEPHLYIADTNNHRILILNLQTNLLSLFPVIVPSAQEPKQDLLDSTPGSSSKQDGQAPQSIVPKKHASITMPEMCIHPEGNVTLALKLDLAESLHLTDEAPSKWQVLSTDESCQRLIANLESSTKGTVDSLDHQPSVTVKFPKEWTDKHTSINVECVAFYCGDDGACRMKGVLFTQPIWITNESVDLSVIQTLPHTFT